jgi:hypothetical protein
VNIARPLWNRQASKRIQHYDGLLIQTAIRGTAVKLTGHYRVEDAIKRGAQFILQI